MGTVSLGILGDRLAQKDEIPRHVHRALGLADAGKTCLKIWILGSVGLYKGRWRCEC